MKSKVFASFLVIIVVVGGFLLWQMMDDDNDEPEPTQNTNSQNSSEDDTPIDQAEDVVDQATSKSVEINNFDFAPGNLSVKKGTTVTWTNKDSVAHTVTSDDEGGPLDSGNFGQNETFSFTFNEVGSFAYHCVLHPQMTGTVTVTE